MTKERRLSESFRRVFEAGGAQATIMEDLQEKDYSRFTHVFSDIKDNAALGDLRKSGLEPLKINYVADYLRGKDIKTKKYLIV